MPSEARTDAQIRGEIAAEREQLAVAISDLRTGLYEKRRVAAVAGGAVVAGLVTATALAILRRLRG